MYWLVSDTTFVTWIELGKSDRLMNIMVFKSGFRLLTTVLWIGLAIYLQLFDAEKTQWCKLHNLILPNHYILNEINHSSEYRHMSCRIKVLLFISCSKLW